MGIKLNLGAGNSPRREGYLNVDIVPGPNIDLVADISKPLPYIYRGEVEEIFSHHAFEHLENYDEVLDDWYRVLAPGGTLEIHTPDMDGIARDWVSTDFTPNENFQTRDQYRRHLVKMAIGETGGYMRHQCLFWPEEIRRILERHGFINIEVKTQSECAGPAMQIICQKPDD